MKLHGSYHQCRLDENSAWEVGECQFFDIVSVPCRMLVRGMRVQIEVLTHVFRDEQVVRAMQSKVTAHLEAWKKAGGMQRPRADEELQDLSQVLAHSNVQFILLLHLSVPQDSVLPCSGASGRVPSLGGSHVDARAPPCACAAQRAKSRFAEFQKGLSTSRKGFVARSQLRQEAAACYISLRNCHGLQELETDTELEACAKGQRSLVGIHDKEYAVLVETAASAEHDKLLKALTSRSSTNTARRLA